MPPPCAVLVNEVASWSVIPRIVTGVTVSRVMTQMESRLIGLTVTRTIHQLPRWSSKLWWPTDLFSWFPDICNLGMYWIYLLGGREDLVVTKGPNGSKWPNGFCILFSNFKTPFTVCNSDRGPESTFMGQWSCGGAAWFEGGWMDTTSYLFGQQKMTHGKNDTGPDRFLPNRDRCPAEQFFCSWMCSNLGLGCR